MAAINEEIVEMICEAADASDWTRFDNILDSIEDINAISDDEDTYLSDCIRYADYHLYGDKLVEIISRFLAKGYDVKANSGANGGVCLSSLCWISCDEYILKAAKTLLAAGAPVDYTSGWDEPGEYTGVMKDIEWKVGGAWVIYRDYSFANTMDAYKVLVNAVKDGKPYEGIDTYHCCIGRRLERVERLGNDGSGKCADGLLEFSSSLALWLDGMPLVLNKYMEFVVDPNAVAECDGNTKDISDIFSPVIGSALAGITYADPNACYLSFDNGMHMLATCRRDEENNFSGFVEIREEVCPTDVIEDM